VPAAKFIHDTDRCRADEGLLMLEFLTGVPCLRRWFRAIFGVGEDVALVGQRMARNRFRRGRRSGAILGDNFRTSAKARKIDVGIACLPAASVRLVEGQGSLGCERRGLICGGWPAMGVPARPRLPARRVEGDLRSRAWPWAHMPSR
jgi:hypothetical protein